MMTYIELYLLLFELLDTGKSVTKSIDKFFTDKLNWAMIEDYHTAYSKLLLKLSIRRIPWDKPQYLLVGLASNTF